MALAKEDIDQIDLLIKDNISVRLLGPGSNVRYELDLRDRVIRVEEELRHQRELMQEGFKVMDKRLELMQAGMDKRFEQVDKRLELMQAEMDKRFEQVDKCFEQIDKRFEQVRQAS